MSRNLCSTHCYYCDDDTVSVRSENRKISKEESEPFFKEFDGMIVADAECDVCGAQYLAWVDFSSNKQTDYWKNDGKRPFVDLSFRAAFNDEPCPEDCPVWDVENTYKRTIRDAPDNTYGTDESRNRWKKRATAALVEAQEVEDKKSGNGMEYTAEELREAVELSKAEKERRQRFVDSFVASAIPYYLPKIREENIEALNGKLDEVVGAMRRSAFEFWEIYKRWEGYENGD